MAYGSTFRAGVLPATLALATAVVHMGSAPASARLTIVSIRVWGAINAVWAVLVAASATLFVMHGGAVAAPAIYLAANFASGLLTFTYLRLRGETTSAIFLLYLMGSAGALLLAGEELLRLDHPLQGAQWSALMLATAAASIWALITAGRERDLVPNVAQLKQLAGRFV
jgi:hypothetical protein